MMILYMWAILRKVYTFKKNKPFACLPLTYFTKKGHLHEYGFVLQAKWDFLQKLFISALKYE